MSRLDDLRIDRGTEEPRSGRRLWPWLLLAALLVALAGAWLLRPRPPVVRTAAAVEVAGNPSGSTTVLNASGYVTARRQATVSSKVTGKVTEVLVEEGTAVTAGQLVARIDPAIPDASLRLAQSQVQAAASAREETRVRIAQAQQDLHRQQELAKQGFTSQAEVDRAGHDLKALEAHLATQQDELHVAERALALRRQDVADTDIRAPFAGIVTSKNAQPGEMISPMSAGGGFTRTGICTLVDMASLEFEVDVNEAYINRVRPGQPVEGVLDAYPDWRVPAHVITIVPTADRQKATVMVRIAIDARDARILPDMGVKVSFVEPAAPGARAGRAVLLPKTALRREGEQDVVFVVHDGKVERRAVQVADATGEQVRVAAGLAAGERVVVEGPQTLHDGDRVRVAAGEERKP
ncbi:MAG TPA: efflux RND transporter periplasmic adaptor subunit [Thermoanaerobaculia bacterium]|jgi:RND family efflux transporter MFP subunit|nr:efflux RND transporter periplasmic adaptor subunit [Thermoanaerobaculia bacterium]